MQNIRNAFQQVIDILPKNEDSLNDEISRFPPRDNETISWITWFLEDFWKKIEEVFNKQQMDIVSIDPDITEFRHMLKNLIVRLNQPENSLNKNGTRSYEWIEIFWKNISWLMDNPTNITL